jgi:hypothetical protein
MPVLIRRQTVTASLEQVRQLLTDLNRLPDRTQVSSVKIVSGPPRLEVGTAWKNRGATLKLPSWDTSRATEVSPARIAWHTQSMVLGMIPVGADWSYALRSVQGGSEITHTFEHVTMFGLPVGPLIKAPFLPMVYLARGAMMAGEKKLARALGNGTPAAR